ncbi:V/A-type H+-transporting ATPase subunit E [Sedimentibacter acidaminivorans]|uniref:V/A-type H+-transporting ATPase subunit E n=1 Tax=Sedimentibacter acidaminivorans TaxID=913099 RepID=A0ABS4GCT9_9FIRM|nr:V-type ATP synthase subunit E family protein [Sedimentibacter acidaminivorans]MBP1925491.1 V/A-type H+-transporting ATPase subunit E [Sedimentibacter acidaminivorans]
MVTIEQKLLLFSKLLNQSMDKKFQEQLTELEEQYNIKLQKSKDEVDNEAKNIIETARKKVEASRIEIQSKTKISLKKERMEVKEKYFNILMGHLRDNLSEFVVSETYKHYLLKNISQFNQEIDSIKGDELLIYLTKKDNDKFGSLIRHEIESKHSFKNITFKVIDDSIIGGIIIDFPQTNLRINMTMKSVLEENKAYIMQTLFEALEAGEHIGI